MRKKTVFVGGPIQYSFDKNIFNTPLRDLIENVISTLLEEGHEVLSAHRFERYGELDVTNQEKAVCKRDFTWMQRCDAFIAVLPADAEHTPTRTDGTCVELGWASALNKRIIVIRTSGGKYSHLVAGLESIAKATYLDCSTVSRPDFTFGHLLNEWTIENEPLFKEFENDRISLY